MRRLLLMLPILLAAGCGGSDTQRQEEGLATYDSQEAPPPPAAPGASSRSEQAMDASAGPDVSPTAAPGVAFNYRYAFRLPAQRVAQVQEEHAAGCERLGPARCRITGMHYRVVNQGDIEAMLAFKLDPAIARRFGRAGVEAVVRAEGMLTESEISGTDVGTSIRAAGRTIAEMNEELARIERRLGQRGLPAAERSRLEYAAEQLRRSISAAEANREEQEESLATTPMVFRYGSGDLAPGFDTRSWLRRAAERAWDNFLDGVAILFVILVTLLPWALAVLLGWLGIRWIRARMSRLRAAEPALQPKDPPTP